MAAGMVAYGTLPVTGSHPLEVLSGQVCFSRILMAHLQVLVVVPVGSCAVALLSQVHPLGEQETFKRLT